MEPRRVSWDANVVGPLSPTTQAAAGARKPRPLNSVSAIILVLRPSTFAWLTVLWVLTLAVAAGHSSFLLPGNRIVVPRLASGLWGEVETEQQRQCPPKSLGAPGSIAMLHIPKTAGSMVAEGLAAQLPQADGQRWCRLGEDIPDLTFSPCPHNDMRGKTEFIQKVSEVFPSKCAGFSTHFDYSLLTTLEIDFTKTLTMVTMRHPADRAISHYYFFLNKLDHARDKMKWYLPDGAEEDTDFHGLIRFAAVPVLHANLQAYTLAGAMSCTPNSPDPLMLSEPEVLALAKRNLARMCFIIVRERMRESLNQLRAFTGWGNTSDFMSGDAKVNVGSHPEVPAAVRRKLEEINWMDMELYSYAVQLFPRQWD